MNKKGFSDKELINIVKFGAALILLYILYKALSSRGLF